MGHLNAKTVTFWTADNAKGHEIHLVYEDKVVQVDLTSYATAMAAVDQAQKNPATFRGLIHRGPKTEWCVQVTIGTTNRYGSTSEGRERAVEITRELHAEFLAEVTRIENDPVYALERAIKDTDWHAHNSDDPGVRSASARHYHEMQTLITKVGEEKARELWEKHAHKDFGFPGGI